MLLGVIVSGFIATIIMTLVMVMGGPMMGLMPKDWNMITDGLGGMINRMMGMSKSIGWVAHFMVGSILHPLVLIFVWAAIVPLSGYLSVIIYTLIFAVMMIVMLPMLEAPEEWRSKMAMGVVVVHLIYAVFYELFSTLDAFNF